jgi:hypothetical protein
MKGRTGAFAGFIALTALAAFVAVCVSPAARAAEEQAFEADAALNSVQTKKKLTAIFPRGLRCFTVR